MLITVYWCLEICNLWIMEVYVYLIACVCDTKFFYKKNCNLICFDFIIYDSYNLSSTKGIGRIELLLDIMMFLWILYLIQFIK